MKRIIVIFTFITLVLVAQSQKVILDSPRIKQEGNATTIAHAPENIPMHWYDQENNFSFADSPYVGSVNGWNFNSFASDGFFDEIGSYFSEKFSLDGQTFYHKGESDYIRTDSTFQWMNTYFRKDVPDFQMARKFWITMHLDFFHPSQDSIVTWFDFNMAYLEENRSTHHVLFVLGIAAHFPWDSTDGPVTFIVNIPDYYYQKMLDSGWVFNGLTINVMSSKETPTAYYQELGFWFDRIVALYYEDEGDDTTFVVLDDFMVTSQRDGNILTPHYSLSQNYPNPFNPTTTIPFSLSSSGIITITVYDILGRKIRTLVDNTYYQKGLHEIVFEASNLPGGVYIYTLSSPRGREIKKMVLLK